MAYAGSTRATGFLLLVVMTMFCTFTMAAINPLRAPGMAEKLGYKDGDSAIVIPARVRELPPYCFAGCTGLKRVGFEPGSKLLKISDFAFAECSDLEEFDMPPGVLYINDGAFRGCRRLKTIHLPQRLQQISRETFAYCTSLSGITLPLSLREIKPLAFLDCQNIRLTEIPAYVVKIGNNAFGRCYSLQQMKLPYKCREVESYAFADCISLQSITLPAKTDMLGELLFSGCLRLREIIVPAYIPPIIECNSSLFEPDDKKALRECIIMVPEGRRKDYLESPYWNIFKKIEEFKPEQ